MNSVRTCLVLILLSSLGCVSVFLDSAAAAEEESHLMRYADIHGDRIIFTYEDDLWLVSAQGGLAQRLTNHPGFEGWAKFSPDGNQIAFTAQYDGGTDIYLVDADGGIPVRLTFHPAPDRMLDWYPDGQSLLFRSRREYPIRAEELYRLSLDGGMPERLAVDRGGLGSPSPDGSQIAYNRISREARTWKRYQGGMAQDIWVADFNTGQIDQITTWVGTDNFPMWYGDVIYFNSDREDGTLNLYGHDTTTGSVTRLTRYNDYDVKYPSVGDGKIVFQYGESLHILNLATSSITKVPVQIKSDMVHVRPELMNVAPRTGSFGLSPAGKRVLLEARGEILNLPAEEGNPVNLSQESGSREKNAVWSPDGQWIAFVSDQTGEEQVYLVDQDGTKPWRQLTEDGSGFLLPLVWSPDSKYLLYGDKYMRLNLMDVGSGRGQVIAQSVQDDGWERWGIQDYVFSPCSSWVAYSNLEENLNESIYLYSLDSKQTTRVTSGLNTDWSPSFSPDGAYLYFLSNRTFEPIMGFQDQNHIFLNMGLPYVVILREGETSPFAEKDVRAEIAGEADKEKDEKKDKSDKPQKTVIDVDGLDSRIVAASGVDSGNYFRLTATDDGFLLLLKTDLEFLKYQNVNDHTTDSLDLLSYSLADQEVGTLIEGVANYHLSANGEKLVYRAGSKYGVVDVGQEASVGDGLVDLSDVKIRVARQEEFLQIFDEAWRVQRDWFYDPNMHGVDWEAIGAKYRGLVPYCGRRSDLTYLIGEMIGELNIGHTYVRGGDRGESGPRVRTGLLGAEFVQEENASYWRIERIIPGINWDPDQRSPLAAPGCPVRAGQYLIAIDGEEITTQDNIYSFLQDKANSWVTITTNDKPNAKGATDCRVQTISQEYSIRYREWVQNNLAAVTASSNGRIGYLHLPNMMQAGLIEFARAFYPQHNKEALVIDERYNGGGMVSGMIIDRLERQMWAVTVPREGKNLRDPERCFHGPWIVLINEDTGSDGEYFAQAIQTKQLAPIMGVRTWGGAVGVELHQELVDDGATTPPQFGIIGLEGAWIIEGHGVVPDIVVMNMPAEVVQGVDSQLEAAIAYLLDRLDQDGDDWQLPAVPAFPDKSKASTGN